MQAIYPAIIIILLALNRSYTDQELTASAIDALPIFPIRTSIVATDSTNNSQPDSSQYRRHFGDGEGSEGFIIHAAVEQKIESGYAM